MNEQQPQDIRNLPVIYANNIRLGLSFSDFRLFMGEHLPLLPSNPPVDGTLVAGQAAIPVDRVCVVITPDLIPQLIDGLTKAVKIYEANYGPLRKPKPIQASPQNSEPV
jgi:hypothetical protein